MLDLLRDVPISYSEWWECKTCSSTNGTCDTRRPFTAKWEVGGAAASCNSGTRLGCCNQYQMPIWGSSRAELVSQFPYSLRLKLNFTFHLENLWCFFILGFDILLRVLYQGYGKNHPSQQFKMFIYIYFAATCFGPCWPSSSGIHNYFREVTSLQRIRCKKNNGSVVER
jgi:hypothetical protein